MIESTDFIVIGSGIAGLRAALELSRDGKVTVLTKDRADESNTEYAQGGVAVALSEEDDLNIHFDDTINAGAGLCDAAAVRILVEEGPRYVTELIEWGAEFDRADGHLEFTAEAAHSRRRIIHAQGDSTGREIVRSLLVKAQQDPNIQLLPHAATQSFVVEDGRCHGVRYVRAKASAGESGEACLIGRAVVLATGGAGQVYSHTTNPEVATGDGVAMAYRAGATISDMEFVQFHPTALALAGAPHFLLSEAMRGEGGILLNQAGERFMPLYHKQAELAPRDIVSRSILSDLIRTKTDQVYLDLTHLSGDYIRHRFPKIHATCLHYDLDITKDRIPVSPAAHYVMGGVRTDIDGRSDLPGLYAAGEVACTGVHGANRLASNSLLEGLVFGARAGAAALKDMATAVNSNPISGAPGAASQPNETSAADWHLDRALKQQIRELMWRYAGIVRDRSGLQTALDRLREIEAANLLNAATSNFITVASLIVMAALERTESRGGHFRSDYPARDDQHWQRHSVQNIVVRADSTSAPKQNQAPSENKNQTRMNLP